MAPPPASRSAIRRLLSASQHTVCPCHGCRTGGSHSPLQALNHMRKLATPGSVPVQKEYAFEVRNEYELILQYPRSLAHR